MKMRHTKKTFEGSEDGLRKLRRNDPIQFAVLYDEWRRMREEVDERRKAWRWIFGGD